MYTTYPIGVGVPPYAMQYPVGSSAPTNPQLKTYLDNLEACAYGSGSTPPPTNAAAKPNLCQEPWAYPVEEDDEITAQERHVAAQAPYFNLPPTQQGHRPSDVVSTANQPLHCPTASCSKPGKIFADQSQLRDHLRYCGNSKIHRCPDCSARFTAKDLLRRHIGEVHTKTRQKWCGPCKRHISRSNNLSRHEQSKKHIRAVAAVVAKRACNEDVMTQLPNSPPLSSAEAFDANATLTDTQWEPIDRDDGHSVSDGTGPAAPTADMNTWKHGQQHHWDPETIESASLERIYELDLFPTNESSLLYIDPQLLQLPPSGPGTWHLPPQ